MTDNPFPKSLSQIRRLIIQSKEMFRNAKPSTSKERKSFNKIASKILGRKVEFTTKPHYQFCVDNDDSCICDQAKDGDRLYVSAPTKMKAMSVEQGADELVRIFQLGGAESTLTAILEAVSYCPRCGFLDD